jgi:hypothetical protein
MDNVTDAARGVVPLALAEAATQSFPAFAEHHLLAAASD